MLREALENCGNNMRRVSVLNILNMISEFLISFVHELACNFRI